MEFLVSLSHFHWIISDQYLSIFKWIDPNPTLALRFIEIYSIKDNHHSLKSNLIGDCLACFNLDTIDWSNVDYILLFWKLVDLIQSHIIESSLSIDSDSKMICTFSMVLNHLFSLYKIDDLVNFIGLNDCLNQAKLLYCITYIWTRWEITKIE